jgi:hypothetical protein
MAVDDGGNFPGPAGAASATLAELGAGLGGDTDLGHGKNSSNVRLWLV